MHVKWFNARTLSPLIHVNWDNQKLHGVSKSRELLTCHVSISRRFLFHVGAYVDISHRCPFHVRYYVAVDVAVGLDGWDGDTCHDHGMIQYSRIAFRVSSIVCLSKRSVTCFGSAFWTFIITCLDADKRMCHIFECVLENAFRRKLTFAASTLCNIKVYFVCSVKRNVMFIQTHSSWALWHIQTLLNVSNNVL